MVDQRVMRNLFYVSIIKRAELFHQLADQVCARMGPPPEGIEAMHRHLEKSHEDDLQWLVDNDVQVTMKMIDLISQRTAEIRSKLIAD